MVDELLREEENEAPVQTMEEMMEKFDVMGDFHRGKVVEGIVVDTRDDAWLVDVGYKCEGVLPRREWTHRVLVEDVEEPKNGDRIMVQVTNLSQGEESQLGLSRWRCEFDARWNKLEEETTDNEIVSVKGLRKVKGGLIVSFCGLEGFIPASHLSADTRAMNPSQLVDKEFEAKLIEKDRRKRRLVFSRRSIMEKELEKLRTAFYEQVNEGDILEGEVSSITSFGVFVNLGAMEGLVHISELSWQRNVRAKDVLSKGDNVKVKVIGIDKDKNRISLSIKQTQPDPWNTVAERWTEGMKTEGVVTNLTDFGAFVEIEPGIEGLVHIGDLSWTRIKSPKDVLKKGQQIEVVVLKVDAERQRISLGYKQLNDPWDTVADKYTKDTEVPVKVIRIADFGVFVELEQGVEGLIHISQLSSERVEHPRDVVKEGQDVTARILEVNPESRRIRLSLRSQDEVAKQDVEVAKTAPRNKAPKRRNNSPKRSGNTALPQEEAIVTLGDLFNFEK